jgi:hypothetical protein
MKLLSTVTWLSTLPSRENATPNYSLKSGTLWTIQSDGLNLSTVSPASPLPAVPILPPRWRSFFMKFRGP